MASQIILYSFDEAIDITEVEATFNLAVLSTESLHGESRVRLETRHRFDASSRSCVIDASGEVGMDLNRLFLGFVTREFGASTFAVQRVHSMDSNPASVT
jgi:hypothetical protein